jgi:phthalate 4,5-cis-dihydrodiol dehydrogenase
MKKLKIGVAGLGRAFAVTAPAFQDARVEIVAGADPRAEARDRFTRDFGAPAYPNVE